jgi:hypothetical protein
MSKSVAALQASDKTSATNKDQPAAGKPAARPFVPLKPRRKLAIALLLLFLLWMVLLYVMYFTTVYGRATP